MRIRTKAPKLRPPAPDVVALNVILAIMLQRLDQMGVWPSKESIYFLEDLTEASWRNGDLVGASVGQDVLKALKELTSTKLEVKRKS